jgi:lipopolysaccharide export system permease protein
MSILSRYIFRSFLSPFIYGLIVIIFVFMINYFIKQIPMLLSKDVSILVIIELVSLNLAWIVGLAIPMAVLVATLMIFGRMSADNEITAMKASGIGLHQAMLPMVVITLILGYGNHKFNNNILPELNHKARQLLSDINLKKPSLSFQEGIFSNPNIIKDRRLQFKKIDNSSNWVYGVTILDYSVPRMFRTILAEKALMNFDELKGQIVLDLYSVEMHEVDVTTQSEYTRSRIEKYRMRIDVESTNLERSGKEMRGDREKNIVQLRQELEDRAPRISEYHDGMLKRISGPIFKIKVPDTKIRDLITSLSIKDFTPGELGLYEINKNRDDPTIREINENGGLVNTILSDVMLIDSELKYRNKLLVEIYKKYSLPAACIVFVFIGVPLGVMSRHGGLAVSGGLSLLFFLIYWAMLITGEQLSDRGLLAPWLAMWWANIIVGCAGIWLTISMIRETTLIDFNKWQRPFLILKKMKTIVIIQDDRSDF